MSAGDISMTGSAGEHVEDEAGVGDDAGSAPPLTALAAVRNTLERISSDLDRQGAAVSGTTQDFDQARRDINEIRTIMHNILDRQVTLENTFRNELRKIDVGQTIRFTRLREDVAALNTRSANERAEWRARLEAFFVWIRDRFAPPAPPNPRGPGSDRGGPGGAAGGAGIAV